MPTITWDNYRAMIPEYHLAWKKQADKLGIAMLLLMHLKKKGAKKDLRLAYTQGSHSAYPTKMEKMPRFISSQCKNKNIDPNNNPCDKKGDKNGRKGDETKLEDKDNNNTCAAGAHIREAALVQDNVSATSN